MNKLFTSAVIVAVSQAIKVRDNSSPWTLTSTSGDMGQVKTDHDVNDMDLDAVKAELAGWYDDKAVSFISAHKQKVYRAALAEMEDLHGPLLETCDEGTLCREEYLKELREKVQKIWTTTIAEFKTSISTAVQDTETVISTNWNKLVQCEIDHPCCSYSEITWINHTKVLTKKRSEHVSYVQKWKELELKRVDLYNQCPVTIGDSCIDLGKCWDNSARDKLNGCACPPQAPPACPATPCANGDDREIHSCKCLPDGLPSAAIDIQTHYEHELEVMRITWDRVATTEIKGFNVFVKGQQVHCIDQSMTLDKETKECDMSLDNLFTWSSGNFNGGDVLQAQIQDVYENNVQSELSDFGGLGTLPEMSEFTRVSEAWEGTYGDYITESGVVTLKSYNWSFHTLYINENRGTLWGQGIDSNWGPFSVRGTVTSYGPTAAGVAFWQWYDDHENGDDIYEYQGNLNKQFGENQSISGYWVKYDADRVGGPLTTDTSNFNLVKVKDLSEEYLTWDKKVTTTTKTTYVDENGETQTVKESTTD